MGSRLLSVLAVVLAGALGAGLSGCSYDPHPVDGTLSCSAAYECPQGYECQRGTNTCWSKKRDAGSSPDLGTPSGNIMDYVGEWLLGVTSNVKTVCDDGYTDTSLLSPVDSPSTMTVSRSGAGLLSVWLCDVTLRWDNTGAHLNDADPSCMDDAADPTYLWTATKFDLVTSNGLIGQHDATYTRKDTFQDGTIVNCNQTVTAPLIKQ